jgi:hypothetical protein
MSFYEKLPYKITELLLIFATISSTSGLTRNSGGRYEQKMTGVTLRLR